MPRKKTDLTHITAHIHPRQLKMWNQIEHKSAFIRLALDSAIGIMQWDIMRKGGYPEPKRPPKVKVLRTYNLMNPLPNYKTKHANKEPLRENSAPRQENW